MSEGKSLAAKMATIMGEVATMTKDGNNVAQKYQYTTAEQVKAAIRPLLAKHRVAMYAAILDVTRETAPTKSGGSVVMTIAKMLFTFVCGDTGEKMECLWYGEANDYADKGTNKAATAGEKYFLTNTFLLSTTEPESDEETIEAAPPAPPASRQTPTDGVSDALKKAINAAGAKVYGQAGWKTGAPDLIRQYTSERGNTYAAMTREEGETLLADLTEWAKNGQTAPT